MLFTSMIAFSQNITVSGTVYDAQTGEPVPGAAVMVNGTSNGVAASEDGKYSLTVAPDAKLVCTCFGYKDEIIDVMSRSVVKDKLIEYQIECLLFGGQISRSFRFMEESVRKELSDIKGLTITTVSDFSNAAFKGLVAKLKEKR